MNDFWSKKVVLVTGAGGGIGSSFAKYVADRGAVLGLLDVDAESLTRTADLIGSSRALPIPTDVTSVESVRKAVGTIVSELGPISMLHNNAAVLLRNGPIEDMHVADFKKVLDINLLGAFLVAQAVVPSMKQAGQGMILNMSSRGGARGQAHTLAYSASKAAILAFTRGLADQLNSFGIKVNALNAGLVETRMTSGGEFLANAKRTGRYVYSADELAAIIGFIAESNRSGAVYECFTDEKGPELRLLGDWQFKTTDFDFSSVMLGN